MARSKTTFSKKEKEARKQKKRKEKVEKREQRKAAGKKSYEDMIAYVDENGHLSDTPPEVKLRTEVKASDIDLGVRNRADAPRF